METDGRDEEMKELKEELEAVKKIQRRAGRYSDRYPGGKELGNKTFCKYCTFEHSREGRCPAKEQKCNRCGKEGHFAKSKRVEEEWAVTL